MSTSKTGRKVVQPNPIRAARIRELIQKEKITITKLASDIGITQQRLSEVLKTGKVSEGYIALIIAEYPQYRAEWLLGLDDTATVSEYEKQRTLDYELNAATMVLDTALIEVCEHEHIDVPKLNNLADLVFIESQLRDYAYHLMHEYVCNRSNSHVWKMLDKLKSREV
jgi:transcriptional regulator with XRE-family HTH domain